MSDGLRSALGVEVASLTPVAGEAPDDAVRGGNGARAPAIRRRYG
ncbi:hypothetical protein AB0L40_19715 [Patulibacter sp. NPDC049589]